MRKSVLIDTEAVLAKTREILEAEMAAGTYQALVSDTSVTCWEDVVRIFDEGMLLEAKVDKLKHEYSVLLTGARPRKPKAKKAMKAMKVTATTTAGASDA